MALKPCKECGNEVSTKAETCPKCGAKVPKSGPGCLGLIGIAFVIVFVIPPIIGFFIGTSGSPGSSGTSSGTATNHAEQTPAPHTWFSSTSKDEITGKEERYLQVDSNNKQDFAFPYNGGSTGHLTARKHPRYGTDLYFSVSKGQIVCAYDDCSVMLRIDDQPAIRVSASVPSDHSHDAVFLSNPKTLIKKIKGSKKAVIEVTFYQAGNRSFEFNTEGMDTDWLNSQYK